MVAAMIPVCNKKKNQKRIIRSILTIKKPNGTKGNKISKAGGPGSAGL